MKVSVLGLDGKKKKEIEVNSSIFGADVREDIMSRVVHWQLARARSLSTSTKTVSDVSGTGKKPFKQKGTGSARRGTNRAVQHRGGAVSHGPVVRSYEYSLQKKVRQLGLKSALSAKAKAGDLIVVDFEGFKKPSTKEMKKVLKNLKCDAALIIDGESVNENIARSVSNIPLVDMLPQQGLNVYSILRRQKLVLTVDAIHHIEARLH